MQYNFMPARTATTSKLAGAPSHLSSIVRNPAVKTRRAAQATGTLDSSSSRAGSSRSNSSRLVLEAALEPSTASASSLATALRDDLPDTLPTTVAVDAIRDTLDDLTSK